MRAGVSRAPGVRARGSERGAADADNATLRPSAAALGPRAQRRRSARYGACSGVQGTSRAQGAGSAWVILVAVGWARPLPPVGTPRARNPEPQRAQPGPVVLATSTPPPCARYRSSPWSPQLSPSSRWRFRSPLPVPSSSYKASYHRRREQLPQLHELAGRAALVQHEHGPPVARRRDARPAGYRCACCARGYRTTVGR